MLVSRGTQTLQTYARFRTTPRYTETAVVLLQAHPGIPAPRGKASSTGVEVCTQGPTTFKDGQLRLCKMTADRFA